MYIILLLYQRPMNALWYQYTLYTVATPLLNVYMYNYTMYTLAVVRLTCNTLVIFIIVLYCTGDAYPLLQSHYGPSNTSIGVYTAVCESGSIRLSECMLDLLPYGNRQCTRYKEAGVRCECKL